MVLGFTCLWFGVLLPVHQRGQIQLPGSAARVSACARCVRTDTPSHKGEPARNTPKDRGNCAVCHFIAGLNVPPPVTVYVARLGLTNVMPVERPAVVPARHPALPFHGLDPPIA
jgi:hypothetical protein